MRSTSKEAAGTAPPFSIGRRRRPRSARIRSTDVRESTLHPLPYAPKNPALGGNRPTRRPECPKVASEQLNRGKEPYDVAQIERVGGVRHPGDRWRHWTSVGLSL